MDQTDEFVDSLLIVRQTARERSPAEDVMQRGNPYTKITPLYIKRSVVYKVLADPACFAKTVSRSIRRPDREVRRKYNGRVK